MNATFWNDRSVLLTGGTGLLGSWLAARLRAHGARLVCLVRDWVPESELVRTGLIQQVTVVNGDVREQALLARVLSEYDIRTVFHLAAQTQVPVANQTPVPTFESNIAGTWTVLEACRQYGRAQVVLASSDKAYGEHPLLPYEETMPLHGRYPYDVSKSCADLLAQSYAATYDLPVAITRCANLFGGGDLNWDRLIPGTIRATLQGERMVIRSDGQHTRDYLYVEDAVSGYLRLAEKLAAEPNLHGEAFNFSNETPMSVAMMVERILALMDCTLPPEIRNEARNEIRAQHLSAVKARAMLGWQWEFSLEEALRRTIQWYTAFLRPAHE